MAGENRITQYMEQKEREAGRFTLSEWSDGLTIITLVLWLLYNHWRISHA